MINLDNVADAPHDAISHLFSGIIKAKYPKTVLLKLLTNGTIYGKLLLNHYRVYVKNSPLKLGMAPWAIIFYGWGKTK